MIIATAGHVDHGKTSLVEVLTGINTDRLKEEKERGLTIDLGFAYTDIEGQRIGFVDVPGHIRFINNMLAGVSTIDFALIVVAADDGVMPQTVEHLAILDLLGIAHGAVAITKTDRVNPARVDEVRAQVINLLAGTGMAGAPLYPVSAATGDGIAALKTAITLAALNLDERKQDGNFRLSIDRVFTIKGAGLIVTGSVVSGSVSVGDEMFLLPSGKPVRVRGLHRQDLTATAASRGDRCALNLVGADIGRENLNRGDWVTSKVSTTTSRVDALIRVPPNMKPLKNGMHVHLHAAANHVLARVATLGCTEINPAEAGLVQLILRDPVNLWSRDSIILRDQSASATLGGGIVIDPDSPARGRNKPPRLAELHARCAPSLVDRLAGCMALHSNGFDFSRFAERENLTRTEQEKLLVNVDGILCDRWVIDKPGLARHTKEIIDRLGRWQTEHPTADGVTARELETLFPATPPAILEMITAQQVRDRKLERKGTHLAKPGFNASLAGPEAALLEKVKPILEADPVRPPVTHDLAKSVGLPPATVDKLLTSCARQGRLVKPTPNRFFLPEAISTLQACVLKVARHSPDGLFDVKAFRDETRIGRNLCIELLEYFDRNGLTVRIGDKRKLAKQ